MDSKPTALTPAQEDKMIEDAFKDLLDGYLNSNHRKKVEIIERAFRFAKEAHSGIRRRSGEPYIMHPIAVAKIVSKEIGLGSTSICAALLHDVVEDTEYTVDDIEQNFGPKIAQFVEGLTKISGGIFGDKASVQAENFRKLLLTMSEDIRVVLIKMADRLHNMRTLGSMAPNKRYKIAGETLYIYAPLAHRLGLFAIKTELEDLSFKHEHPDIYRQISEKIHESEARRSAVYSDFSEPIKRKLDSIGIKYDAKARLKSIYSIYNKMETKHLPFEEVYDLYAMRIVFECDDQSKEKAICWIIYSAITDLDEIAEKGFAAHWKYKIGEGDEESELNAWLRTIKDILDNPEPSAIDFLNTLKLNLFASEIVVFTPAGELLTLPSGSTVLDLAFNLHSEIGMRCIAGKVNHKLVPLSHVLRSGDQAEVLTSKTQTPQPEWENHLVTAKAKTRLRQALRKMRQPMIAEGRKIFEKWLADNDIQESNAVISKILGTFHASGRDDLYYQLGAQEIVLADFLVKTLKKSAAHGDDRKTGLLSTIIKFGKKVMPTTSSSSNTETADTSADDATEKILTPEKKINTKEIYRLKHTADGANYKLAQCCHPIHGDDVMGFINDEGIVEIHSLDCPEAQVLKAGYGSRIVATEWDTAPERFLAHLKIEGIDRHGILQELIQLISTHMGIDIRKLEIEASGEVFECDLWVKVADVEAVSDLCRQARSIDGVTSAARVH